jgi:hypothetical protein
VVIRLLFKTGAPPDAYPRGFGKRLLFWFILLFTSMSEKIFSAALPGQFAFPGKGKEIGSFKHMEELGIQVVRVDSDEHAHLATVLNSFLAKPLLVLQDGSDVPELIKDNPFLYAAPTLTDPFVVDIEDR